MPFGQSRLTDITIGQGTHGLPCCPHMIIGIWMLTSPNDLCNNLGSVRLTDITIHSCPHCGVGMSISSSVLKKINNLGSHRLNDVVTEFCGMGMTVSGSPNTIVG